MFWNAFPQFHFCWDLPLVIISYVCIWWQSGIKFCKCLCASIFSLINGRLVESFSVSSILRFRNVLSWGTKLEDYAMRRLPSFCYKLYNPCFLTVLVYGMVGDLELKHSSYEEIWSVQRIWLISHHYHCGQHYLTSTVISVV